MMVEVQRPGGRKGEAAQGMARQMEGGDSHDVPQTAAAESVRHFQLSIDLFKVWRKVDSYWRHLQAENDNIA